MVYESFGDRINVDRTTIDDDVVEVTHGGTPTPIHVPSSSMNTRISHAVTRRRRVKKDTSAVDVLVERVSKMVNTLDDGFSISRNKDLGQAISAINGFEKELLIAAYKKLYENPKEAGFFIGLPSFGQQDWIEAFAKDVAQGGHNNVAEGTTLEDE